MRSLFILSTLLFATSAWSQTSSTRQPQQTKPNNPKNSSAQDQRGTKESPLFIKEIPTAKTEEESAEDAKERAEKSANDKKVADFTEILALVGALQLIVFGLQSYYLRKTVQAASEQSGAMERAITEANRSASAMEKIAKDMAISAKAATDSVAALKARTAQQMRAYLTVVIGGGIFQERTKSLRFEGKPMLINTGHTPAHNVRYWANAAILPVPLPDAFSFPPTSEIKGGSVMGPQQNAILSGIVEGYCDDSKVVDVKIGKGESVYVWGVVDYEDVFGESHVTRFCQTVMWTPDDKVIGFYIPMHNDAT